MRNAVGYATVSTAIRAEDGVSVDAQRAKIEAWAIENAFTLLAVHVDAGVSGGPTDTRPALQSALDHACKEKAAVVVYSLSHLACSIKDAISIGERLDSAGADLVSLLEKIDTTKATGEMTLQLLATFAEFARDKISERIALEKHHQRARSDFCGGEAPYGWKATGELGAGDRRIIPDADEQAIIAAATTLSAAGLSLRMIGARLTAQGMLPRKAKVWHPSCVSQLLTAKVGVSAQLTTDRSRIAPDVLAQPRAAAEAAGSGEQLRYVKNHVPDSSSDKRDHVPKSDDAMAVDRAAPESARLTSSNTREASDSLEIGARFVPETLASVRAQSSLADLASSPHSDELAVAPGGSFAHFVEVLLGSPAFNGLGGERGRILREEIAPRAAVLADHGGQMSEDLFAERVRIPIWRVAGAVAQLAEWLNRDGYPVIVHHNSARQVRLNLILLEELFGSGS